MIPRTLAQNCGANVIRTLTKLRAKHAEGPENCTFGIDGNVGTITDMKELGVWEPYEVPPLIYFCSLARAFGCGGLKTPSVRAQVKVQTIKTAVESAAMLLRIDDIVSGIKKPKAGGGGPSGMKKEDDEVDPEQQLAE